ncbi:40S ribosomal protein S27-like [Datura stramonium]|uniref:40S ribosomal protein S27 n=1 Tax=Datura stramonium TaxID=4076 RepID=A0ABS8S8H6_DATST|nr:40S ribosomal protein S27-like [Datura stramonium]
MYVLNVDSYNFSVNGFVEPVLVCILERLLRSIQQQHTSVIPQIGTGDLTLTFVGISSVNCQQLATSVILQKPQGKMGIAKISNDIDLLHPPAELEKQKHKLKRLVQSPDSTFLDVKCQLCPCLCNVDILLQDVKCQGCFQITTIFSHSQTVVTCPNCQQVLCQPTGGCAKLTEGCSFRVKEKAMMVLG